MTSLERQTVDLLRSVVELRGERRDATIVALSAEITCWEEVIACAREHRVMPLLYSELVASSARVPAGTVEILRREFERNAFQCIANAAELLAVLKELEIGGIRAIPFKGVVLGALAYRGITERNAGDLDVLIDYADLQAATKVLTERGYTLTTKVREDGSPESADYFEYHFERPSDGMVLELRWRLELTQPRFRKVLGLDWVWQRRQMMTLAGQEVPCVDPVTNLLVLCMHGAKHGWSRLMWISDVARLLESQPRLDWASVDAEAKEVGLWRAVGLGILLAHRIASTPVPAEVLRRFERDGSVRRLAAFFSEHAIENAGARPPGRVPYNIQILDSRDRAAVVLSPRFLRPTAQDRAAVRLPDALAFLYYAVRPFRLLLDRTARR